MGDVSILRAVDDLYKKESVIQKEILCDLRL